MTTLTMAIEAIAWTLLKAWFVGSLITLVWIGARLFIHTGRGAESIWPDADEPRMADAPSPLRCEERTGAGARSLTTKEV